MEFTGVSGKWGSFGQYGCDTPADTFHSLVEYVKNEVKPDIVLWTGDFVPHEVWAEDYPAMASNYMRYLSKILTDDFSESQVYAILGNHDFE